VRDTGLLAYCHNHEASDKTLNDPEDFLHVHEAMHAATFILFYTRLRGMPFIAQLIRRHVTKVRTEDALVAAESLSSRALVFTLFIVGCEAVDSGMRELVLQRTLECRDYAVIQMRKLGKQLEKIWRTRDNEPGQTWFQSTKKGR
jgi:hypothetical protein